MDNTTISYVSLTLYEQNILLILRSVFSVLSLVGCTLTIGSMIVFDRFSIMASRLVFSLTFSALILAIADIMSIGLYKRENDFRGACITQGWLLQFSENAIFAWTTTIALNFYLVVCWSIPTYAYEKFYHILVWSWALLCACVPFSSGTSVYALAGIWCWIARPYPVFRFVLFYVPFLIQVGIVIVFYILIIRTIRNRRKLGPIDTEEEKRVTRLVTRLRIYPIIFFASYFFPAVNRINEAVTDTESFPLYVLHSISSPGIGLAISIAYGLDEDMQLMWKQFFHKTVKKEEQPAQGEAEEWASSSSSEELTFQSDSTSNK